MDITDEKKKHNASNENSETYFKSLPACVNIWCMYQVLHLRQI